MHSFSPVLCGVRPLSGSFGTKYAFLRSLSSPTFIEDRVSAVNAPSPRSQGGPAVSLRARNLGRSRPVPRDKRSNISFRGTPTKLLVFKRLDALGCRINSTVNTGLLQTSAAQRRRPPVIARLPLTFACMLVAHCRIKTRRPACRLEPAASGYQTCSPIALISRERLRS